MVAGKCGVGVRDAQCVREGSMMCEGVEGREKMVDEVGVWERVVGGRGGHISSLASGASGASAVAPAGRSVRK